MRSLQQHWYRSPLLPLLPLEFLFRGLALLRRQAYGSGLLSRVRVDVPVIVVGNISVGGTGKTPLTLWLVKLLREAGLMPGIVTRGYGGQASEWPQVVEADSDPFLVGDEPVLMARRCGCPVVAAPDRVAAAQKLLSEYPCDILISDDGMQHYRLERDIEIAVIDGTRRFGNGHCLPVGPLREPVARLREVDFIVTNGDACEGEWSMQLRQGDAVSLNDASISRPLVQFMSEPVHAVAGIGHPERFFTQLRELGIDVIEHPFADHYRFNEGDLDFNDDLAVLMTEKDAIKCQRFATRKHWYVPVEAGLDPRFSKRLLEKIEQVLPARRKTVHG